MPSFDERFQTFRLPKVNHHARNLHSLDSYLVPKYSVSQNRPIHRAQAEIGQASVPPLTSVHGFLFFVVNSQRASRFIVSPPSNS